jgi:hypothetical protein
VVSFRNVDRTVYWKEIRRPDLVNGDPFSNSAISG